MSGILLIILMVLVIYVVTKVLGGICAAVRPSKPEDELGLILIKLDEIQEAIEEIEREAAAEDENA